MEEFWSLCWKLEARVVELDGLVMDSVPLDIGNREVWPRENFSGCGVCHLSAASNICSALIDGMN